MYKNFKSFFLNGNRYGGIEHTFKDGQDCIYATILKKVKNEVLVESHLNSNSIKELTASFPKSSLAYLIINNENVLTKKVDSPSRDSIKLVHTAFPNINLSDFFYESIIQNEVHFVSICRRAYVEEIIETYKTNGILVTNLSLGNLIISSVTEFLEYDQIFTSNSNIEISEDQINSIEKRELTHHNVYDINGLVANSQNLLSTSGALVSILETEKSITNFENEKQQLLNDYKNIVFFKHFLKFGLILIFGLLLINFLIFNHYFNKVTQLEHTSVVNKESKLKVTELNEKVLKSQKKVEDMLNNNSSLSSYFISDIMSDLPETINFKELNFQPLTKRIKAEEPIKIESNIILISGESNDSESFSIWINQLEDKNWIKKIEVVEYGDLSPTLSNFSIKIQMHYDQQD